MTNATTLLNTEETYRTLQPFQTVEQLNANTKAIRDQYAAQMTRATYDVLDALHRWACKFPGVCFRSKAKIADALGYSRRTVIRACQALEDLGIIVQYETKRQGGDRRQSSNAIVFVKQAEIAQVTPNVTPECHAINTPADTPKNTNTVNTNDTAAQVIHSDKNVVKIEQPVHNPNDKAHLKASLPDGWFEQASGYAVDYADLYGITGALFKGKHGTDIRVGRSMSRCIRRYGNAWASALERGSLCVVISPRLRQLFATLPLAIAQVLRYNSDKYENGG